MMFEAMALAKTILDLFGQLRELASAGRQRRRDDEYRREFERLWIQIALLQNQFFQILMNQSVITANLQQRVDELRGTVGSLQFDMRLMLQTDLLDQPTDQVRRRIGELANHAEKQLLALPFPAPPPVFPPDPTRDGADDTERHIQFSSPQPQPLPPTTEMTPERRLVTLVRLQMTAAPYYRPCMRYDVYGTWRVLAFISGNDGLIHALAIEGLDPQTATVRYYRHAHFPVPADDDDAWDGIFAQFQRILNTRFVALPGAGIDHLVERMEHGAFDKVFF